MDRQIQIAARFRYRQAEDAVIYSSRVMSALSDENYSHDSAIHSINRRCELATQLNRIYHA